MAISHGVSVSSPLELLRPHAKRYGPLLAQTAFSLGQAVTGKDGILTPIPITATPVITRTEDVERCCQIAALIGSAGLKMARSVLDGPARELLLASLAPLERQVVERSYRGLSRLALSRVDFFISDRPRALELNATIPAMTAYSDMAAQSFLEVVGRYAGIPDLQIASLEAKNGSNAHALYRALLEAYSMERKGLPNRIALLIRRNDPQQSEMQFLKGRFEQWGTETEIVYPDELSGDDAFCAKGKPFDLVYRHLFVRRLEELNSPYLLDFFSLQPNPKAVLLNGPAAHVETKTNFALLSQAGAEPELAQFASLTPEELSAIREAVPWTRALRHYPGTDPDGGRHADLAELVAAHPERFVLKRAWDYGGRAVFVGRSWREPGFEERARAAYGQALSWQALVERASVELAGGGFVVQEIVNPNLQTHLLCQGPTLLETELYVDFSAYASVGLTRQPAWGAVCRGSSSQIVNIAGGGGVLPLIRREVWDVLEAALRTRDGASE